MYQEKDKYRLLIENLPDGLAYCKMVRDNTGKPLDYIFLELNPSFEAIIGFPRDHIIGKKLTEVYPGIKGLGFDWIGVFDQVSAIDTGQNIHFQQYLNQQDRWYEITAYSDQLGYFAVVFRDITENKKAEEELRQREKNFSTLVENAPDMIVRFNLDLQHIYCNAAVEHQLGVPVHRFIGKTFLEIDGPPEELKFMHQLLKKALETGKEQQTEQRFPLLFGQKYFQTRIVPERDEKGRIESLLAVSRDISERKQAEEALQESDKIFKQFMENSPNYVFFKNDKDQAIRLSSNYEKMLGKPMHELLGKTMDDLFPSDLAKSMIADDLRVLNEGKQITVEEELNGRFYTTIKFPILVEGKPRYLAGYTIDITERKQAEEELKESEERFRRAITATKDGLWERDIQTNQEFFAPRWCEITGYSFDDPELPHTYESWASRIHPDDYDRVMGVLNNHLEKGTKYDVDYRHRHKSGEYRWQNSKGQAIFDESGKPIKMVGFISDITERKQVEEALRKSEINLVAIMNASTESIFLMDLEGGLLAANESLAKHLGTDLETLLRGNFYEFLTPDVAQNQKLHVKQVIKSGKPLYFEDESFGRTILNSFYPIFDSKGQIIRLAVIGMEITERKKMEERERHFKQVLLAIRNVNQLIVQETDPERLIDQACQILTETLGYYNAWIVLFDEDKKVISIKAYGFIDGYNLFEEQLKQGKYPLCIKKAFQEKGTIVIDNASDSCPDCPLYSGHVGRAGLSSRIQHGDKLYGMLTVSIPREYVNLEETSKLFIELAGNLGLALYKISLEKERKKTEEELKLSYQKLQKAIKSTIQAIALILEKRDPYTAGHQKRMTKLACAIAEEISLSPDKIERLYIAGIIHDIGKINVPTEILSKPGRLSEIEFSLIQTHPQVGSDILKEMELPGEVSSIVLQHHERMDGSGYPSGLSGEAILLEARILAVADVVEAMASNRPYRPALGLDKALEEITKNKAKLYDPEVVDVCLKLFKEKRFKFE
jgi:PAS domain S-box-containing protein/putative nucleotidyltransferase with HDIG domain